MRKVTPSGIISTIAGDTTGASGATGDGGPATSAMLNGPYDVAFDGTSNIYIADRNNEKIRKIDGSGVISTFAGNGTMGFLGEGTAATAANLNDPLSVTTDAAGNVYVADYGNNRIRKINTSGIITTFAGTGTVGASGDSGPATSAQLVGAIYVKADNAGNLYIAEDATGNKLRVVNSSGIINTYSGTGLAGFAGDGSPALTASLSNVRGVATDPAGNVYLSDNGNNRIRMITNTPNHAPAFTGGHAQTGTACSGTAKTINTLLAIVDTDIFQTKTWSVVTAPLHGTLVAAYGTTVIGTSVVPTGLSYTSAAGYTGTDVFSVAVTDGWVSDTTTVTITVNPLPAPVISLTGTTLSTTASFTTYQWLNGSSPIAGATNATYDATVAGSYAVKVTNSNGCMATSALQAVTIPISEGVHELTEHAIELFPNPATAGRFIINLAADVSQRVRFVITNTIGIKMKELDGMTNTPTAIEMNVPVGVYFISAISGNGKYQAKVVIQ